MLRWELIGNLAILYFGWQKTCWHDGSVARATRMRIIRLFLRLG